MEPRPIEEEVKENTKEIETKLKADYPTTRLFHLSVPYVGEYYIRPQVQSDVNNIATEVDLLVEKKIAEQGGENAFKAKSEEDRSEVTRSIDLEAGELSNILTLKSCVVYPFDFADILDKDEAHTGVIPLILDNIMIVSGWTEVKIREV